MTLALSRRRDYLAAYTHLELMESEAIEQAADKAKMTQLAGRIGIPVPKTFLLTEVQGRLKELCFPVVIKLQKESPGRLPIRYAHSLTELNHVLSTDLTSKSREQDGEFLVQEFIPGYGCGFFATYQYGVCKRIFMHRRVREFPAAGGVSSCAESFYDPKLEMYGRRMLDALGWHGVAMVEFRRDARDEDYKLMEINPKFWGSLDLALAGGADFPGDLCRMALGWNLSFTDRYERNLRFQWPFSVYGEIFHVCSRPHSLLQVALDFLNPGVKSNIWASDFMPNLEELRALGRQLLHGRKG
jgi:predicted ATP-grasp superfamily ATP-dependent carboligase